MLYEAVEDDLTSELQGVFEYHTGVVSIGLITVILGTATIALILAGSQIFLAASSPVIKLVNTLSEPNLQLHQGLKWHLFLSHSESARLPAQPPRLGLAAV